MVSGYRDSGTIEDGSSEDLEESLLLFVSSRSGNSMAWEDGAGGRRLRDGCRDEEESSHSFVSWILAKISLISASACSSRVNCLGGGEEAWR